MIEPLHNNQLIGHEDVLKFFENSIKQNTLHNSYIFSGKYGIGKETAAIYIAKKIISNALNEDIEIISKRMQNGTLDNFLYIKKPESILVEDTKTVINFLGKKTASRKCIVIDAVENMTVQAANALLKSIEEAKNVTFFLITSFIDRVLNTIKSRSIIMNFKPLTFVGVEQILNNIDYHVDREILSFCNNSAGMVLKISALEKESGFFSSLLENFSEKNYKITQAMKENVRVIIEIVFALFENVLLGRSEIKGANYRKIFIDDVNRVIDAYQNIITMYKNYQLYNLDKDGFLNFVFSEINKIKA